MPDRAPRPPKYRHYKPKDLALVRIDGHDHYLGKYGSPESWEKYARLIAEWRTSGRVVQPEPRATDPPGSTLTTTELVLAYWRHAEGYYRSRSGQPMQELDNVRDALRLLRKLYGSTPAAAFGPLALRALRDAMIRSGLARTTINARVHRIRRAFRWAASVELIPVAVVQALETVAGLQRGRSGARDPEDVALVPIEDVEATLPHLSRPVAAMVRLQLLTGCRAGEVMALRGCDLAPGEPNWEYRPASHKSAWRGKGRVIPLGPKAQQIVKEFLKPDLEAFLFDPREAVAEHHARRAAGRRSKPTPSEKARRCKGVPGRGRAARYARRTYRQAIVRACRKAGVCEWTPLMLRHTDATTIRARYGLEAAQVILGHAKANSTALYAERDLAKAHAIAAGIG